MRTWRCLPISATSCANGDWNVSMQTGVVLNVCDIRRQYDRGGSVIPSSRFTATSLFPPNQLSLSIFFYTLAHTSISFVLLSQIFTYLRSLYTYYNIKQMSLRVK
jgi:hypothetical protein